VPSGISRASRVPLACLSRVTCDAQRAACSGEPIIRRHDRGDRSPELCLLQFQCRISGHGACGLPECHQCLVSYKKEPAISEAWPSAFAFSVFLFYWLLVTGEYTICNKGEQAQCCQVLSRLFDRTRNARAPTSPRRSTGFCEIWDYIGPSSSSTHPSTRDLA